MIRRNPGLATTGFTVVIAALVLAAPVRAHHSISMFEISMAVWVKGVVVRYEPGGPHAMIELDVAREGDTIERWTIEGPFPGRLERILRLTAAGADEGLLQPGDPIEVCGFRPKAAYRRQGSVPASADTDPATADTAPPFLHGQVLVMRDGRMQSWGPYGKIDNCIRPGDPVGRWAEFLNADPLARDFWCIARGLERIPSGAPEGFVGAVDRELTDPCD